MRTLYTKQICLGVVVSLATCSAWTFKQSSRLYKAPSFENPITRATRVEQAIEIRSMRDFFRLFAAEDSESSSTTDNTSKAVTETTTDVKASTETDNTEAPKPAPSSPRSTPAEPDRELRDRVSAEAGKRKQRGEQMVALRSRLADSLAKRKQMAETLRAEVRSIREGLQVEAEAEQGREEELASLIQAVTQDRTTQEEMVKSEEDVLAKMEGIKGEVKEDVIIKQMGAAIEKKAEVIAIEMVLIKDLNECIALLKRELTQTQRRTKTLSAAIGKIPDLSDDEEAMAYSWADFEVLQTDIANDIASFGDGGGTEEDPIILIRRRIDEGLRERRKALGLQTEEDLKEDNLTPIGASPTGTTGSTGSTGGAASGTAAAAAAGAGAYANRAPGSAPISDLERLTYEELSGEAQQALRKVGKSLNTLLAVSFGGIDRFLGSDGLLEVVDELKDKVFGGVSRANKNTREGLVRLVDVWDGSTLNSTEIETIEQLVSSTSAGVKALLGDEVVKRTWNDGYKNVTGVVTGVTSSSRKLSSTFTEQFALAAEELAVREGVPSGAKDEVLNRAILELSESLNRLVQSLSTLSGRYVGRLVTNSDRLLPGTTPPTPRAPTTGSTAPAPKPAPAAAASSTAASAPAPLPSPSPSPAASSATAKAAAPAPAPTPAPAPAAANTATTSSTSTSTSTSTSSPPPSKEEKKEEEES